MKKNLLLSLLGIIVSLTAMAQLPQSGKYYRIVNVNKGNVITEDLNSNALSANAKGGKTQYNQLWRLVNNKLQNANTLRYFNTLSTSVQGYTGETGATVSFEEKDNGYVIICGQPAHADAGNSIVGWYDKNNKNSWWRFEEVAVDAQALKDAQNDYKQQLAEKAALMEIVNNAATITPIVEGYFSDKACTMLKDEYAGMTDDEFKAKMTADELPEQIMAMVMSIKNKWKDEFNPAMSERFRIQDYKIYSRCDDAGNAGASPKNKWVATQMSDKNNPTGIWTDALQLICVFVENEIPEGASLKIGQAAGSGVITGPFAGDGGNTELHQGMNIVYCNLNYTTHWIVYTCAADYNKPLSTYPDIKIHIEGGNVLGYVNKTADNEEATNAEYKEVLGNAIALMKSKGADMNNINFSVKGERGLFEFPVESYRQIWSADSKYGYKIYKSINFYDNVLKWEWSNMGWQTRVENGEADNELEKLAPGGGEAIYPTYVNNLAPTMQAASDKNPYSGNSHTGMPGIWAVESSYNAERADFDTWCCGHESGHNNQGTINLPSCTESSNNYFSNIITSQHGYRLSRGWNFAQNYDYVTKNIIFSQRDISITMRMYYNLWLYYHQAGKNKQFSPKLFKLLRADRMRFGGEGWHDGKFGGGDKGNATTSWLKFYEKACEAAGEDLTEYFRMWGFLTPTSEAGGDHIEKIGNRYYAYCGDYSSYYIHCEKSDIDAAIARVKAKGYPENLQIMFIEDRLIPRQRHDPWATAGSMKPTNWGTQYTQKQLEAEYGNVGDVLTYIDGSANTSKYTYILSGNKISLKGKGGVGFIVYDKNGNNVYMSNRYEFEIPATLATEGFTIKAINADGTSSDVTNNADDATPAEKLEILQNALTLAADYTVMEDATNKKVGFYSSEVIATLKGLVEDGRNAIKNKDVDNYLPIANSINAEVLRLQAEDPSLHIVPNALYNISCVRKLNNTTRYVGANAGNDVVTATSSANNYFKWAFIPANDKNDGTYYLQNRSNSKLMGAILNEKGNVSTMNMVEDIPASTSLVKLVALGHGVFTLRPMDKTHLNMDPYGAIALWGAADEGSQWNITLVEDFEDVTDEMMNEKIQLAQGLINDICDYSITKNKYTLQVNDATQPGYLSTNQPGASNYPLSNAIDGRPTSFFMSNRDNNAGTTEPHHLKVDLGNGVTTKSMQFYIYGNRNFNYAKTIIVYGSSNGKSWTKVATVNCKTLAFTSNLIKSNVAYRYWRFDVAKTAGKYADTSSYPWFTANEFEVYDAEEVVDFKAGFETLSKSTVISLVKRSNDATSQMARDFRTKLSDYIIYSQIKATYDLLYNKASEIDPTVSIDGINADDGKENGNDIYDLSGRKLNKVHDKGVYVIGGKKVIR